MRQAASAPTAPSQAVRRNLRSRLTIRALRIEGFDFLGFNVRRYRVKLLIKPSKAAVRRLRKRLTAEMRILRGSNAMAILAKLNPIIKGWAAYYRPGCVQRDIQRAGLPRMEAHLQMGQVDASEEAEALDSSTSTSASITSSGMIGGYSGIHTVAPTSPSSPGLTSSGTPWSSAGHHRMTPP